MNDAKTTTTIDEFEYKELINSFIEFCAIRRPPSN